ncbi:hypothetical protein K7432_002605 [Basidiobolus ranarum]|uniref:Trichome birefringence-like N-terminal domain-containing protein n=1 Tax=Basidiobolus ranarum TaxID=34480 RepID=A0ABR2W7I8_9FUNG
MPHNSFTEKLLQNSEEDLDEVKVNLPVRKLLRRKFRLICSLLIVFGLSLIGYLAISKEQSYASISDTSCSLNELKSVSRVEDESDCNIISNTSTDFQISICQSRRNCHSGYVLIERTDKKYCKEANDIEISPNPSYTELFHAFDGPDTFYVNFTGVEKYSIYQWLYDENCAYKFPYQFSNAGEVSMEIIHVYKDYDGVNEVSQSWPPYLGTTLITGYKMEVCPGCLTIDSHGARFDTSSKKIRECSREISTPGAWLAVNPHTSINISTSGYVWTPLGCQYPNTFRGNRDNQCFRNKRSILFFGDSQIRVMYENLWRRLEGQTTRVHAITKFFDMKKEIGNITLWHHKDVFLEDIVTRNDSYLMSFDTLVFNFAQWPASGPAFGGHWTTERFLNALNNITDFLIGVQNRRPNERPLHLIWQGIHAFSMKNIYSKKRNDWRTLSRLKNWNRLAENMVRSKGIKTMNSFEITYSMLDTSPDNAHYYGTDAEEAVVDEAIHKLDLCTPFL